MQAGLAEGGNNSFTTIVFFYVNTHHRNNMRVDLTSRCRVQAKEKYEKALEELSKCTPQYMENMEQVFDQCQQFEEKRLSFLREMLMDIKRHLNLTENQRWVRVCVPPEVRRSNHLFPPVCSQLRHDIQRSGTNRHLSLPSGRPEVVQQRPRPWHAHELAKI